MGRNFKQKQSRHLFMAPIRNGHRTGPVVHGDQHHVLVNDGLHAVDVLAAQREPAPVDPDHHGKRLLSIQPTECTE